MVDVGKDSDGETISSCIIEPAELPKGDDGGPKLSKNQKTFFQILHAAGTRGLTVDDWNEQAREAGIGMKRRADLIDFRMTLQSKGLIQQTMNGWTVKQP